MEAFVFVPMALLVVGALPIVLWSVGRTLRGAKTHVPMPMRLDSLTAAARALGAVGDPPRVRGAKLVLTLDGRAFAITASDFGKHGPAQLWLGTALRDPPPESAQGAYRAAAVDAIARLPNLVLRAEDDWDRVGKALGLNRELQTGDRAVDPKVYVEHEGGDEPAQKILATPALRAAAAELVTEDAAVVLNAEGHAMAVRWLGGRGDPIEAPAVERAARALARLADEMPAVRSRELRPPASTRTPVLLAIGITLALLAVIPLVIAASEAWAPIERGFYVLACGIAAACVLAGVGAAWAVARGKPAGLRRFLLVAGLVFVATPGASAAAIVTANALGVGARSEVHTTVRERVVVRRSRGRTSYALVLDSWQGRSDTTKVDVSPALYQQASVGAQVRLVLGHGRLGFTWVEETLLVAHPVGRGNPR